MCISPTVRYEDQGNVWGKKKIENCPKEWFMWV